MRNEDPETLVRWNYFRAEMRRRREELGLSQRELSARINRSQDFIAVLENNDRSIPNLTTIWLWTDALNGDIGPHWTL